MRKGGNSFLAAAFAVFALSLGLPATLPAQEVKIGGSGFGLGVVKILGEAFERSHPGTKVRVVPSLGSTGGIKALLHGSLDIAISGRAPDDAEQRAGAADIEIARTPFVFIVNGKLAVDGVTNAELENIYNGKTLYWPNGTRVRLVLRPQTFRNNALDVAGIYDFVVRQAPRLPAITAPTTIVTGDHDGIVLTHIHSYGSAREIPGARLIVLPGTGHSPHWSNPEAVIDAVEDVADRGDAAPTALRP